MTSTSVKVMKLLLRAGVKRDIRDPDRLVRHLRRVMNAPLAPSPVPRGVRLQQGEVAGVPGHWLSTRDPAVTVLYSHGGAFVGGRLETYHNFCGRMAQALNARVFMADYRLAPEHPYPAATDDIFGVYRELIDDPRPMVIAGDSAGGNLTLATLLRARDQKLPQPACALAISPGTDCRGEFRSRQANNESDPMLSRSMIEVATQIYLAGADATHPYASPCLGDYTGLPPLLLTVSDEECLRDDAYIVAQRAREAGVPVQLLNREGLPHVWPVFTFLLPEARRDFQTIIAALQRHLNPALADRSAQQRCHTTTCADGVTA